MKIIKKIITFLGIIFLGSILLMLIDSNIGGGKHIYGFLWLLMVAAALVFVIRWKPRKTSKPEDYKEPIYFRDVIAKLLKNSYLRFTFLCIISIIFNQIFPLTPDQLGYVLPNYLIFSVLLSFPKTRTKKVFFSIAGIYLFLLSIVLLSELTTSNDISSDDLESWWVKGPFIFIGLCVWFIYIGYKSNKSKKLGEENYFTQAKLTKEDLKFLKIILIVVSIIGLITAIFLFINENIDQLIHISLIAGIPLGALLCAIGSESLGEKDDRFKTGHKENFEPMVWVTLICFIIGIPWFIAGVVYTLSSGIL